MASRTSNIIRGAAIAATLATVGSLQAGIINITGTVGGAPTGVNYLDLNDLPLGSFLGQITTGPNGAATVSLTPNAQVVIGSVGGQYAAPYLSGGNGTAFGGQPNGPDLTRYITSGSTGNTAGAEAKLAFATDQQYLGLLWGSIDNYNRLEFFDENGVSVGVVTGTDVVASPNGDQGVNGTLYVNINVDPFRYVVATSSQFAFEFDNVAYNEKTVSIPDGGSTLLLTGFGLMTLGLVRRRLS